MLHGMDEPPATYSISLRLQRTATEQTYLSVPIDAAIMQDEPAPDGSSRIDPGKLWAQAIRLAEQSADWTVEDRQVTARSGGYMAAIGKRGNKISSNQSVHAFRGTPRTDGLAMDLERDGRGGSECSRHAAAGAGQVRGAYSIESNGQSRSTHARTASWSTGSSAAQSARTQDWTEACRRPSAPPLGSRPPAG
jgi:hypothetical protein